MTTAPPPSASGFLINLVAGLCYVAAMLGVRFLDPEMPIINVAMICLAAGILPIILGEFLILKVHRRPRAALLPPSPPDRQRIKTKTIGYMVALGGALVVHLIWAQLFFSFFEPFLVFLPILLAVLGIGGWLYIDYTDPRLAEPNDSLYHFGLFARGRWRECDMTAVRKCVLSVALRVFFMPIMYVYMAMFLSAVLTQDPMEAAQAMTEITDISTLSQIGIFKVLLIAYLIFCAMDVLFATIGYLMVFRPMDSDIRSIEPTFVGWISCIICYSPFWEMIFLKYVLFNFYHNPAWYVWFENNTTLLTIWGILVIGAMLLESGTTMTFGARFSNLTYRGLISAGPFRLTKHPQYIAKLMNRFLFYVPFLAVGGLMDVAHQFALFFLLCFIYYLRARTEENHLSRFPEYVEYAQWVDKHGLFRFMGRIHQGLGFDPARAQAGKLFPSLSKPPAA